MRFAVVLVVLAGCSDDVEISRWPGSPSHTRTLTFFDNGRPVAIGGDSEFGLAYLQSPDGDDAWLRASDVPAFNANATLLRGAHDVFAIGETQAYRASTDRFEWTTLGIPAGITTNTAFSVDDTGHIFALELAPDGDGAVLTWRTDTNRWEEVALSRPIGVGAATFAASDSGNTVVWSTPAGIVWLDRIANTRTEIACDDAALGCEATVRDLVIRDDETAHALVCGETIRVVAISATGVSIAGELRDTACRSIAQISYGTVLVVGDSLYALHYDDGLAEITEADPELAYTLYDASTAFGFGNGIYKIDF